MSAESSSAQTVVRGHLSKVRFASDDGRFSVCELTPEEGGAPITVVGNILATKVGQSVEVCGQWVDDRRFGRQLRIDTIRTRLPQTKAGIQKYLASAMMDGIGPTLARRMVAHFGDKTLDIIDGQPERIQEVEGIGKKRAAQIVATWRENRGIHELMAALRSHGVSAALAIRIHRLFGDQALAVIERNPYQLVEDVRGVGFQTADEIARHVGIEGDSPARLRAGIMHVLRQAHDDGHTYLPGPQLQRQARQLLGSEIGALDDPIVELKLSEKIVVDNGGHRDGDGQGPAVYLAMAYRAEVGAAERLSQLGKGPQTLDFGQSPRDEELATQLQAIEDELDLTLAQAQRRAVLSVFRASVAVITGGPGTGKTTIVRAICQLCDRRDEKIALAAPTGRAAKRLTETTERPGQTIHRLLEYRFEQGGFQRDEEHPIDADVIVVDEASMIDIYLLYALVRAVAHGSRLVFVGDIDQLPSVGPGQVLRDIIDGAVAEVTRLTEIYRQHKESAIVSNAHRINQGLVPVDPPRKSGRLVDFYTIHAADAEVARQQIEKLVTARIPEAFGLDPREDIQILSPMYRGQVGCDQLNQDLQQYFCGGAPELRRGSRSFRLGDRVMQRQNNYDDDVFNGDVGRVVGVDTEEETLEVSFDGQRVAYAKNSLDQLDLAYAVTVHKSQGSEYPAVIIPVTTAHYVMLRRNLLYTAVTRGKRLVVLVGTRRAVEIAVGNGDAGRRHTGLARRLAPTIVPPGEPGGYPG